MYVCVALTQSIPPTIIYSSSSKQEAAGSKNTAAYPELKCSYVDTIYLCIDKRTRQSCFARAFARLLLTPGRPDAAAADEKPSDVTAVSTRGEEAHESHSADHIRKTQYGHTAQELPPRTERSKAVCAEASDKSEVAGVIISCAITKFSAGSLGRTKSTARRNE
ncbi:hypothetical protein EVAR_97450_1 [Eumeta japonica]|uniref:Uncharacterized protein n=1 Tax=Eumeta variegata TaxID=151549 RepID=A0A4C1X0Z0_EUMVA|nr:hypothetical protein EVAR_97450_1 [Eumeta japonica]